MTITQVASVSVIVPCHNHGIFLDDTIASIRSQTHQPLEILIVDDGSNDEFTLRQLERYHGGIIYVIRSTHNGPAAARNLGVQNAKGEYLLFWDADDLFHSTFTEKAINILKHFPRVGAVSSWALCFGFEDYIWYCTGGDLENFKNSTTCPVCSLVRRAAWAHAGGFDESYRIGYEDWDFWIRLTKKDWLVYIIPDILFYYRQKRNSRVKDTFIQHTSIYQHLVRSHPDVFSNANTNPKRQ
jgi:glycosyltransferase involved in cell wall biosynthesis